MRLKIVIFGLFSKFFIRCFIVNCITKVKFTLRVLEDFRQEAAPIATLIRLGSLGEVLMLVGHPKTALICAGIKHALRCFAYIPRLTHLWVLTYG